MPRRNKSCALLGKSGLLEELAALRKVSIAARDVLKQCKGTGVRYPSLIKAVENLDETYDQITDK